MKAARPFSTASQVSCNYLEIKILNIIRRRITIEDKLPRYNYYHKLKSKDCQSVLPSKIFKQKYFWINTSHFTVKFLQ